MDATQGTQGCMEHLIIRFSLPLHDAGLQQSTTPDANN